MTADLLAPRLGLAAADTAQAMKPLRQAKVSTPEEAKKAGREFEAMFVSQMMQHMFAGVRTDGWFGGGKAEEMFRPMLLEQYGKMVANGRGIGVADAVARTLLRAQEVSS